MRCIRRRVSAVQRHIKVSPWPPVPGRAIMHTDTFACAHIGAELMEEERQRGDERGLRGDRSGMGNEREADEGKAIEKLQTFSFTWEGVCVQYFCELPHMLELKPQMATRNPL